LPATELAEVIQKAESLSTPIRPERLIILIRVFLKHFYEKAVSPDIEKALIVDWINDLKDFPEIEIRDAMDQYRRTDTRKPSPASVRNIIMQNNQFYLTQLTQAKKELRDYTPPVEKTPEQKARVDEMVKNLFKEIQK
jgi:hypothetical protein